LGLLRTDNCGLLLLILLEPLLSPTHSAGQSSHRRARGCTGARVAGYGTTHRTKSGTSGRASRDVPLWWQGLVRRSVCVRRSGLRLARVESSLLDRP
jgi:hypothetical protein